MDCVEKDGIRKFLGRGWWAIGGGRYTLLEERPGEARKSVNNHVVIFSWIQRSYNDAYIPAMQMMSCVKPACSGKGVEKTSWAP